MSKKVKLTVEVDKDLLEHANDLFDILGLDIQTAINVFLAASIREMGIPFYVGFHDDDIDDCDSEECHCKKNS